MFAPTVRAAPETEGAKRARFGFLEPTSGVLEWFGWSGRRSYLRPLILSGGISSKRHLLLESLTPPS